MRRQIRSTTRRSFISGGIGIAGIGIATSTYVACQARSRLMDCGAAATDDEILQSALNRKGAVHLDRTYVITSTLTISGGTQLIGNGDAKIVWKGPASQPILRDSSVANPQHVNRDILLQGFEIVGGSVATGDRGQIAIEFYRTGNVTIRDLIVHGVGGSGIRWGNSYSDTTNIVVENCTVYDCRMGDGIQGSGRGVIIRNNTIGQSGNSRSNFGDTGIALIADFSNLTNPGHLYSSDVTIENNIIIGNYDSKGGYKGIGSRAQTGVALGPFTAKALANITISKNVIKSCYVNVWVAVMRNVKIVENMLGPHSSPVTASLRLDGVSGLLVSNNILQLSLRGRGPDYSGIMLTAQRNIFGASVFDTNVDNFVIRSNTILSNLNAEGIRLGFGQINKNPDFVSRIEDGVIEVNKFIGVSNPITFAPQIGETPKVCRNVSIRRNIIDDHATTVVYMAGNPNQYVDVIVHDNITPSRLPIKQGTGV